MSFLTYIPGEDPKIKAIEQKRQIKRGTLKDIRELKLESRKDVIRIFEESVSMYLKSFRAFGAKSDITRNSFVVLKDMVKSDKELQLVLNYLIKNIDTFNIEDIKRLISLTDSAHDYTIKCYNSALASFNDSLQTKTQSSVSTLNQYELLSNSTSLRKQVIALAINEIDIVNFLGYEKEFWDYIKSPGVLRHLPVSNEEILSHTAKVYPIYDHDNNVCEFMVYVPEVCDLTSALYAIRTYEEAYRVFKAIGKKDVSKEGNVDSLLDNFENGFLLTLANKKM